MNRFYIFLLRIFLGAFFAVVLLRFFYPDAGVLYMAGLAAFLVALAYLLEAGRKRRKGS